MPFNDGGAGSNLVRQYYGPETTELSYGFAVQFCQTFRIDVETVFHQFVPKITVDIPPSAAHFILYNTDAAGKPAGAPIYDITKEFRAKDRYEDSKWRRVVFPGFPVLAPGLYALVLTVPAPHVINRPKWAARETPYQYPFGKSWKSGNFGGTWAELPNTNFLFEAWGWTPPPDPPPTPTISNWAPLDLVIIPTETGFKLIVTTDIPCHLYMRWTTTPPLKHRAVKRKRGLEMDTGVRYCFVAFHENEQLEEGDTLIHTFLKPDWAVCETRWFYFIGSVQREEQPSASPIFSRHRLATDIPSVFGPVAGTLSNRTIQGNHAVWENCHDAASGNIGPWHGAPWTRIVSGTRRTATFWVERGYLFFDTSALPPGCYIVDARLSIYLQSFIKTSSIAYPNICITEGVQDDPVVATNYGDQLPYTTIGGQRHLDTFVLNEYNDIDFNLAGLSWINPGGITKLCLRQEMDIYYVRPPLGANQAAWYSAQGGVDFTPLLTVDYFVP